MPSAEINFEIYVQPSQPVHEFHRLQVDRDDAAEEVEGVTGVVHGFEGLGVWLRKLGIEVEEE